MPVDFDELWAASTAMLPDDDVMLWRLLRCIDDRSAALKKWNEAIEGRTFHSHVEIQQYKHYHLRLKAIEVFRKELITANHSMIGFLYGQSVRSLPLGPA
jgi:hypothetical protein